MAWLDNIKNDLKIKTGDGKEYKPLWKPGGYEKNFNFTTFEAPGVSGTLVKRQLVKGRTFDIIIFFIGENHLIEAATFERSAENKKYWQITHPYFGLIFAQPTSLKRENTDYNATAYTINLVETITDEAPKTTIEPLDQLPLLVENTKITVKNAYQAPGETATAVNIKAANDKNFNSVIKIIKDQIEAQEYRNYYEQSNGALSDFINTPNNTINKLIDFQTYPGQITSDVNTTLDILSGAYEQLRSTLAAGESKAAKQSFEAAASANIIAQAEKAGKPAESDYKTRAQVVRAIERLSSNYALFLDDIDALENDNLINESDFIANHDAQININNLVNTTISNLFKIALGAKTEFIKTLTKDDNLINLTARLYGGDIDENIEALFNQNNLGLNSILGVIKGQELKYYV